MSCGCLSGPKKLLYACSGAANTGLLADQVARRLSLLGEGKMTCLAGVGAEREGFLKTAAAAEANVVIDGCPTACGRRAFERLGLPCRPLDLTQFGVQKGVTVIDESVIDRVSREVAAHLQA
ncbi:MAG TPA: putative zinc-binding protein [Holophaga sp.]|nr:putative zinc-binding protein [Holophaga sp.]